MSLHKAVCLWYSVMFLSLWSRLFARTLLAEITLNAVVDVERVERVVSVIR